MKIIQNHGLKHGDDIFKSNSTPATLKCEGYHTFKCYYLHCIWWYEQILICVGHYELFFSFNSSTLKKKVK